MSLKVWLPLNGTLENKGCSNITFSGTPVWRASGKIGSSAYNLSTRVTFNCPALANIKYFSIAFWGMTEANTDSTANWMDILSFTDKSTSGTTGYFRFETGYGSATYGGIHWHDNATNAIINGSYTYNNANEFGKWHHIVVTVSETAVCSYYDGVLKSTLTANLGGGSLTGAGWIGESTTRGGIQDIRVYDHCLSAAEVHEISQGLVLHYKLDGLNNASILPAQYQQLEYIESSGTSYFDTGYKLDITNDEFKVIFKGNDTSNTGMIFASSSAPYIWLYYYGSSGIRIYADNGSNGQQGIAGIASDLNQHTVEFKNKTYYIDGVNKGTLSNTYGITKNNIWLFSYGGSSYPFKGRIYYVEIKNNGTHKRIFIPAKRLSDATIGMYDLITRTFYTSSNVAFTAGTAMGTLTIQDSSGYSHNGAVTGNITLNSSTPRYSASSLFNGTERITTTTPGADIRTLSCWCKTTKNKSTSQQMVADSFSNMTISFYNGTIIGVFGTTRGTGSKCTLGDSYKENDWNHIVVVKTDDAGARDIYCNGVKLTPTSNDYWSAATGFFVGARNTSNGNPFYGQISDVRAYCTALSAADVKQLYQVSAKVDNLQGLHTFEIKETNRNLLAGRLWSNGYSQHNPSASLFTNFNSNGEYQFTANGTSAGSEYIPINPTGHTYEYDYTISVNAGNQFYIGFERYDANKTARSNNACVYTYSTKPSSNIVKQHFKGTVNLSTDGTNPCAFIALRILNGWSGTTSGVTGIATIHNISLREIGTKQNPKLTKQGQFIEEELKEETNMKLHKNGIIETNNLIER